MSASLGSVEACRIVSVRLVNLFEVSYYARFARAGMSVNLESVDKLVSLANLASLVNLVSLRSDPT